VPQHELKLADTLFIRSQIVPHRAEFSDTVGYFIRGSSKTIFYCPDVDSWHRSWSNDNGQLPRDIIQHVDRAFLDATFYNADELPNRSLDEIPHPTVEQTLETFQGFEHKITLIHFNHSNPLFNRLSWQYKHCEQIGIDIGRQGTVYQI
jgi:pyrroloquinoline quinone biosynthesis protein B